MTTITGLDSLNRKLKDLERIEARHLRQPMEWSVKLLHDDLGEQPRKAKGAFTRLATPKQRRWYWAAVKRGAIGHGPFGYKRTNTIQRGWTTDVKVSAGGVKGTIGNVKKGAIFVQGEYQQPFHKESGWRTTDEAVERNADKILAQFKKTVRKVLSK